MRSWVAVAALAAGATPVWAQQNVSFEPTGRVQVQYNTTNADVDDVAASTFETRRVRLGTRFTVDEWLTGMAEVELALGDLAMRNVWANFAFTDGFQLRAGHMKKPFSLIEQTSSSQILTIERGVRIRGLAEALLAADTAAGNPILSRFGGDPLVGEEQALLSDQGYSGFELGAAFHGTAGALEWEVGVFNGSGEDRRDTNDDKSFAARATVGVPGTALTLGAGASRRELGVGDESIAGTAFALEAEWGSFRSPLHLQAELAFGDNIAADESFLGTHLVGGLFRPIEGSRAEGWELVGRASWGDPNRSIDGDEGVLLTPGAAIYFTGRNRIQLNWDVWVPSGDRFDTMHALRAQAQLYF